MNDTIDKTKIQAIKIDQNRVEKASEELDTLFEIAENSLIVQKNEALSKHSMSGNFDEWKDAKALDREQLRKNVAISKKNIAKAVNDALVRTIVGVNQTMEELSPELVNKVGNLKVFKLANNALNLTADKLMSDYDRSVAKVYKLRNQEPLYEAIREQSNLGIENGIKIVYRNGRKMTFKAYMEMNVRTTVRQEANEFLFKASKNNKVVVYISSYFGDSADDHKDYQRRYYYDKDWRSFGYDEETTKKIEELIKRYKMVSYQSVVYEPPYLTTRPNCRHTLRPVPLDDFFHNTPKKTAEEYGMSKGTYKTDNYRRLQEQRYNERMIRKYKTRLVNDMKMQQNMNSPEMAAQIRQDHLLIAGWEARQRRLIKANPFLKRDYRRETNKVIVQDVGARYHMGMDIKDNKIFFVADANGNPIPPTTPAQAVAKTKVETPAPEEMVEFDLIKETSIPVESEDLPEYFQDFSDVITKKINDKNADPKAKYIFKNLKKLNPYATILQEGYQSRYDQFDNTIYLNKNLLDDEKPRVLFHELGHNLDYLVGSDNAFESYENDQRQAITMGTAADEEFNAIAKEYKAALNKYKNDDTAINDIKKEKATNKALTKKQEDFVKEYMEENDVGLMQFELNAKKEKYEKGQISYDEYKTQTKQWTKRIEKLESKARDIARKTFKANKRDAMDGYFEDIVDAIKGGEVLDNGYGSGHGSEYYAQKGMRETEIFANYFSILGNGDTKQLQRIEKYYPDIKKPLDKMLDRIILKIREHKGEQK